MLWYLLMLLLVCYSRNVLYCFVWLMLLLSHHIKLVCSFVLSGKHSFITNEYHEMKELTFYDGNYGQTYTNPDCPKVAVYKLDNLGIFPNQKNDTTGMHKHSSYKNDYSENFFAASNLALLLQERGCYTTDFDKADLYIISYSRKFPCSSLPESNKPCDENDVNETEKNIAEIMTRTKYYLRNGGIDHILINPIAPIDCSGWMPKTALLAQQKNQSVLPRIPGRGTMYNDSSSFWQNIVMWGYNCVNFVKLPWFVGLLNGGVSSDQSIEGKVEKVNEVSERKHFAALIIDLPQKPQSRGDISNTQAKLLKKAHKFCKSYRDHDCPIIIIDISNGVMAESSDQYENKNSQQQIALEPSYLSNTVIPNAVSENKEIAERATFAANYGFYKLENKIILQFWEKLRSSSVGFVDDESNASIEAVQIELNKCFLYNDATEEEGQKYTKRAKTENIITR